MAMKLVFLTVLLVCSASPLLAAKSAANPLDDVVIMLGDLQQKAIKEGETAQKAYSEFVELCQERAGDLTHQIKNDMATDEDLEANIAKQTATESKLTAKVENLGGDAAADAAELKQATDVRNRERAVFLAEEKELMETDVMLRKAITILKEKKTSMLQVTNAGNLAQTFSVMVQASLIGTADATKLTAFVQAAQGTDDSADDEASEAPAAAAYESKSGSIVETLEDLLDKAEGQLEKARKTETDAQHNYDLMKQSLGDQVKFAEKDMDAAKKGIAAAEEEESIAQGELTVAKKELAADSGAKSELHHDCMAKARGFESETQSRDAEINVLTKAKSVLKESGASLTQLSFAQVSSKTSSLVEESKFKVVRFVRDLGHTQRTSALVQLADRMASAMRSNGKDSEDVFAEVKSMISDMIAKLEKEVSGATEKKAWCDEELGETKEKKDDTADVVEELDTKVDQLDSREDRVSDDSKELQDSLGKLAKYQAEMDKMRAEERAEYGMSKDMIEKSLSGTKVAIKVLKEYFSQDGSDSSNSGGASTVISLLEEIESKFSAWLMDINAEEESAASEYSAMTSENGAEKAAEETDLGYKKKTVKKLGKKISQTSADEANEQEKLDSVVSYYSEVKKGCVGKAESFEEEQEKVQQNIEGLKEAIDILDKQMALVQVGTSHRLLRGSQHHHVIAA